MATQLTDEERREADQAAHEAQQQAGQAMQAQYAQADEEDAVIASLSRRAPVRRTTIPVAVIILPDILVPETENTPPYKQVRQPDGSVREVPFRYRVRPPEREERQAADKEFTTQVPDPRLGRAMYRDVVDTAMAERKLLYVCTVPEDKRRFWDNKALQDAYNCGDALDLIRAFHNDRQQAEAMLVLFGVSGGVEDERTRLKG